MAIASNATQYPVVSEMNISELAVLTIDTDSTIEFLKRQSLLFTERTCPSCQYMLREIADQHRNDKIRWRCTRMSCRTSDVSIRRGTFFESSKLQLNVLIRTMYLYSYEMASTKNLMRECRSQTEAATNWKQFFRDVYAEYFIAHPQSIGGVGHTVQIDESCFCRRKYNVGRMVNNQWVFGGIDMDTKQCFLVAVEKRDAATLLPILQQYVLHGTTVVSDLWRAYNTVGLLGYQHLYLPLTLGTVICVLRSSQTVI